MKRLKLIKIKFYSLKYKKIVKKRFFSLNNNTTKKFQFEIINFIKKNQNNIIKKSIFIYYLKKMLKFQAIIDIKDEVYLIFKDENNMIGEMEMNILVLIYNYNINIEITYVEIIKIDILYINKNNIELYSMTSYMNIDKKFIKEK